MINKDSIQLLKQCDSGVKMGISSIDDVLKNVENKKFREVLLQCKKEHEDIQKEIEELLYASHTTGKDPNMLAKSMSWIETNMKLIFDSSDQTIADLMTDGCNMGIKSLRHYMNEYSIADETSKNLANRLIQSEHQLVLDMSIYL